jgi:hypothetical protein
MEWRTRRSTQDFDAGGPGFDSHPDPGWHFNGKTLISRLSDNRLKNYFICL